MLACITYGVIHDQVTARICIAYFTIGHPTVIPTNDPTVLGIVWGVIATWWVGVLLGVLLAITALAGKQPPRRVGTLIRPIAKLCVATAILAILAGLVGYLAARAGWVGLVGDLAQRVPATKHVAFIMDMSGA